jgi:hypothetical protein
MSLDEQQRAGLVAPPSKLPMVLVVLLVLALTGALAWYLLSGPRAGEADSGNTANLAAPAQANPGRGELLPSGLRVETIREGNGPLITRADAVLLRYELRVPGGPVIESNMDGPQGHAMTLNGAIPGIVEGITRMRPGGIARFWVPPQLGYGDNIPTGATFDRNDTLEFLIRIEQVAVGRAAEMEANAARAGNETQANTAGPATPRGRTGTE